MLFNSYEFLFAYFPISLAVYFLCQRFAGQLEYLALLVLSLFFYAWWNVYFLPLLLSSITVNYIFGTIIASQVSAGRQRAAGWLMAAAVALNLAVLGVFKYSYFAVTNLNAAFGTDFALGSIILPLGISFFTFEQISFLVDVRRGQTRPSLLCTTPCSFPSSRGWLPGRSSDTTRSPRNSPRRDRRTLSPTISPSV